MQNNIFNSKEKRKLARVNEYSLAEKRELGKLIVKDYEKELKILEDRTHHDSKRKKHLPLKPKQGFLAIAVVFSNVYFSLTVNMSFQLSI